MPRNRRSGVAADQFHNNCSGKHTGFLSVARHLGHPTKGYIRYEHPVQQRILGLLESMTGLDLSDAPRNLPRPELDLSESIGPVRGQYAVRRAGDRILRHAGARRRSLPVC